MSTERRKKQSEKDRVPEPIAPPPSSLRPAPGNSPTDQTKILEEVGNAAVAATATDDSLARRDPLSLQSTYGNAILAQALIKRKPDDEALSGSPASTSQAKALHNTGAAAVAQQPAPAPAAAAAPFDEAKRFEDIKKILDSIPSGKAALKIKDDLKISVKFVRDAGVAFDANTDTMIMDPNYSLAMSAMAFVHEITHAKARAVALTGDVKSLPQGDIAKAMVSGAVSDLMSLTRAEYVKRRVEEEAEGTVKSIEAKIELEGTKLDVSKDIFPLEKQYRDAYKDAVAKAKKADPLITEDAAANLGREAGKQRVINGFMSNEVETSNTHEPYPIYYGKDWDRFHPKK